MKLSIVSILQVIDLRKLSNLHKSSNFFQKYMSIYPSIVISQLNIQFMSLSQRNDLSRSLERKSLQRDQLNILLYKNADNFRQKQSALGRTSRIPSNRSKAKSSQGNYPDSQSRKKSIDMPPMIHDKTGSIPKWVEGELLLQRKIKLKGTRNNYEFLHVMGRGGFSKVWKVEQKKTGRTYALKEMSKALIITKKSIPSVLNQKTILSRLKHPFVVNMNCTFQDKQNLYLVMEYMSGGDLRYHICCRKKFTQDETRFFICCIFLGLEYLHSINIIHRDIKPQNLVLDSDGYLRITDFGIAKQVRPDNSADTSGTPGYMAPEVMVRQNHSFGVDHYALGVIAYQLMIGKRPYPGRSRPEIKQQILSRQAVIKKSDIPEGWSIEAADFINKLLQRKPMMRLGWGGSQQIRSHPWLKNFPWQKLSKKLLQAPFKVGKNQNNFDMRHNITVQDQEMMAMLRENGILLRKSSVQQLFEGYTQEQDTQPNTTASQFWRKKCY